MSRRDGIDPGNPLNLLPLIEPGQPAFRHPARPIRGAEEIAAMEAMESVSPPPLAAAIALLR